MIKDYASISDKGLVREINQDSIYVNVKDVAALFVVADGMGGHQGGEIASTAMTEGIQKWWEKLEEKDLSSPIDTIQRLMNEIKSISADIYKSFEDKNEKGGTTVCALLIMQSSYAAITVGDSRVYGYDKELKQLTTDDVWENLPTIKKTLTEKEINQDNRLGKLTQAAGFDEEVTPRVARGMIHKGMSFLVCTDGVYKYCEANEMEKALKKGKAEKILDAVQKSVLTHGAGDNYSAIVCRIP